MTQPRMHLAGTTYLVTRTVQNRRFLLKPDPVVNDAVLYGMFRAANAVGTLIHAVSVESNHIHLVVTDPSGELSDFMKRMDRLVACCLVAYYRELEPSATLEGIWSKGKYSATSLLNANAVIDKLLYTLTNPVKDGLVPDYRKWPGLNSRPGDWGKDVRYAERPEYFFNQNDKDWERVPYRFTVPPMLQGRPTGAIVLDVEALLRERHSALRSELAAKGRSFMGVNAVLATSPFDTPNTVRPQGRISPTVAAGGDKKLMREAIALVRSFREAYRKAWLRYASGLDAIFPAGTLLMRLRHHVVCDVLDAPWCAAAQAPT